MPALWGVQGTRFLLSFCQVRDWSWTFIASASHTNTSQTHCSLTYKAWGVLAHVVLVYLFSRVAPQRSDWVLSKTTILGNGLFDSSVVAYFQGFLFDCKAQFAGQTRASPSSSSYTSSGEEWYSCLGSWGFTGYLLSCSNIMDHLFTPF